MTIKFNGKILVTGAAGFIGGKLIEKLKKNNLDFIGVDHTIINNKYNILDIDLNDTNAFINLIKENDPKFIFHFAGYSGPARNDNDPELAKKLNVDLTKKLINSINKNTKIFFSSTDKVYDNVLYPDENARVIENTHNKGVHGKLKIDCEKLIKNKTNKFFIFRQTVVHNYGGYYPNTKIAGLGSFIDQAIDDLKKNKPIKVFSNIKRCFIKIDELINIYIELLNSEKYGIYNVGSSISSYSERIKNISNLIGINKNSLINEIKGNVDPKIQDLNTTKFENTFNFKFT